MAVHDGEPDHEAFRGIPSIRYALTQQRRAANGWIGLGGNSGNSTEPHVHVQGMDPIDPRHSRAIPISFQGGLPRNREIVEVP